MKKTIEDIQNKTVNNIIADQNTSDWRRLKDQRLYIDNDYALETLKRGLDLRGEGFDDKDQTDKKTVYHCFWYGNIGRKQVFSIKSFLCTQDLHKCRVILWLDMSDGFKDHEQNPLLKAILPFIEVRAYDPVKEIKETPWENYLNITGGHHNLPKRADAFRFLILYKYGGLYFDLDVMFLRNFGGLLNFEFCYAWEAQSYANSALLNLKRKGDISTYILEKSIQKQTVFPWGIFNYSDSYLKELYVFPCAFFDPIWQGLISENYPLDTFPKFFEPFGHEFTNVFEIHSYKDFFSGCYAYHWHNQWFTEEHENSFFGIFEKEFNGLLNID